MTLSEFHPAVAAWFAARFDAPTPAQRGAWPAIRSRRPTLVAAPTGSGKTLAAFLAAIDELVRLGAEDALPDETRVIYVSPLKALSNDIRKNLEEPLSGIRAELGARGLPDVSLRAAVRTGDTRPADRQAMLRTPPHLLVTTPESLFILLTSAGGRRLLETARTVIVDEIHALVRDKRGAHLALSLERLDHLAGHRLVRVGLSATQRPLEEVARFLVGARGVDAAGTPGCEIVDEGHLRRLELGVEMPRSPLSAVMATEERAEVHDRLAELAREHRTTLVFVNTRRQAERVARDLAERLGEDAVTSHHGSLSREARLDAEERLKHGRLRALVATASLELGIDVGDVDLVCQVGTTRSIATLLQRVGRAGHGVDRVPRGRLFPTTRDELVECAALLDCVRRGELDQLVIPEGPLDILAQQVVAAVATDDWPEDGLFELVRRSWPYRRLSRRDFDAVVDMLARGYQSRTGRRGAWIHHDAVGGRLRGRRGAGLAAMTSGGAIPDTADYDVLLEPDGVRIGSLNEDFAIESLPGDIFQLGNASWRIVRVETGRVRVEDARGQPPTLPFWLGEAPSRTPELSRAVSRLRGEVETRLVSGGLGEASAWLEGTVGLPSPAAAQVAEYLEASRAALGVLPTQDTLVLERFFDESGTTQLVLHSPFGSRLNRAWGLALRKRFCRKFNFELQAAADEDALSLALGPSHSFPLDEVFGYLHADSVRDVLVQALLAAPMFQTRWRWNATRSLAVLRHSGGRRVPPHLLRMRSDDLLSSVFPDSVACAENLAGDRDVPDHPLVRQTVRDCLEEAMDVDALESLLASIARGERTLVTRDLVEPSPLAREILGARPYAFLDDAPLEERRARAVQGRRWLDPTTAGDLGTLDPEAIEQVRSEAWPEASTADELHDALVLLGVVSEEEGVAEGWRPLLRALASAGRASAVLLPGGRRAWVAAERWAELRAAVPEAVADDRLAEPGRLAGRPTTPESALVDLTRGRLEAGGPTTVDALADLLGIDTPAVDGALLALEVEGAAMRGRFRPGATETEWCDRRLLARISHATLARLRREIEPVTAGDFARFLFRWQRLHRGERAAGAEGLASVLELLEGWEAPASSWEADLLPVRVERLDPAWLDALCLGGRVAWARRSRPRSETPPGRGRSLVSSLPLTFAARRTLAAWGEEPVRGPAAGAHLGAHAVAVSAALDARGAAFAGDLVGATGLLPAQVDSGLAELVAAGLATCDGFAGLRALLRPAARRPARAARFPVGQATGRWDLVRVPDEAPAHDQRVELAARTLLRRYGVLFRRLVERETLAPPWRDLVRACRRLEARGEVRGGRFVGGMAGEQYALPEAVAQLRAARRRPRESALVSVSAADPAALVGLLTPGPRLAAVAGNRVLLRDGLPVAVLDAGEVGFLEDLPADERWKAEKALRRQARADADAGGTERC